MKQRYDIPKNVANTGYVGAGRKAEDILTICNFIVNNWKQKNEISKEIAAAHGQADESQLKKLARCEENINNNIRCFETQLEDGRWLKQCEAAVKTIKIPVLKQMLMDRVNNYKR